MSSPAPKDSWLLTWSEIDDDQREVDMRIGEAVAAYERERIRKRLAERWPGTPAGAIDALIGG